MKVLTPRERRIQKLPLIGWREWVELPRLGVKKIKAKIDSGARTSALHAVDIKIVRQRGRDIAHFRIHPLQRDAEKEVSCSAEVVEYRSVTTSGGHTSLRPVIITTMILGERTLAMELTLVNRDLMGFRMLVGRQAIRDQFLIDPGRSFLFKKKKKK